MQGILFNFNVQPDFQSGTHPTRVIVNTHSFHSLHILYEVIPSWLIKPVEKFEDRCTKHKELAARARGACATASENCCDAAGKKAGTGLTMASYLKTVGM